MHVEPAPWPADKQPNPSPTYMAYVLRNPEPVGPPSAKRSPRPPATNMTEATLRLNETKAVYEHFHAPFNNHNRFMAEAKDSDKQVRSTSHMAPPPFDRSGLSSIRPKSAGPHPRSHRRRSKSPTALRAEQLDPSLLMQRNITTTGAPCFAAGTVLPADLEQGCPLYDASVVGDQTWRVAHVLPYEVPPSSLGHGAGGQRPFHQDYRHYKYFGYAGKGAKTSWACNPKQSDSWVRTRPSALTARPASATGTFGGAPQPTVVARQPGQPLTSLEAKLIVGYPTHAYSAEKKKLTHAEVLDPYVEYVSVLTRQPLDRKRDLKDKTRHDKARVATYLQPVPGELTLVENPSPNHGSMSPFHQRYAHYRRHGFSGAGATSSWARNPKLAILHDAFPTR